MKTKAKRTLSVAIVVAMVLIDLMCVFSPEWYAVHKRISVPARYRHELEMLGEKAAFGSGATNKQHRIPSDSLIDVPVGAILVYDDSIIGHGCNTVHSDSNAGGHAEINAISDAVKKIGWARFKNLDRNALTLYSTYEPCPMCIGALEEYQIKHIVFIKNKPLGQWLRTDLKHLRYEWQKRKSTDDNLQDSLFRLDARYKE